MHSGSPISGGKSAVFSCFHKVKRTFPKNHSGPPKSGKTTILLSSLIQMDHMLSILACANLANLR